MIVLMNNISLLLLHQGLFSMIACSSLYKLHFNWIVLLIGANVSSGNGITLEVDGSLKINEVQLIHSGNYSCMAFNSAGSVHADMALKVLEREGNY